MRAVWSFWSKPYQSRQSWTWLSELHHLLAWVLSVETARRHYPDTELVTDAEGAAILVDGIGLHFERVSTMLDDLSHADPGLWTLGKLFALRVQESPFVHVDPDCFLWNPLPDRIALGDVFAQSPEPLSYDGTSYYDGRIVKETMKANHGWLPEEMSWFLSTRGSYVVNTGIVGGNRLDFIRYYADSAIRAALDPANERAWSIVRDKTHLITFIEQGMLSACIEYHHGRAGSIFSGLKAKYLFPSTEDAKDPAQAKRIGFTHLLGPLAKRDEQVQGRLQARVALHYPEQAKRCKRYLAGIAK